MHRVLAARRVSLLPSRYRSVAQGPLLFPKPFSASSTSSTPMSGSSVQGHRRYDDAAMSAAAADLVPPLTGDRRKGQAGRVAVIGGCREYTGAPYFAAMAALRTGADLAHVFCTPGAAPVIKAYSPDLIVHPLLRESCDEGDGAGTTPTSASLSPSELTALSVKDVERWLPRFDVVVVGPGLGSDPAVEAAAAELMRLARDKGIALLVDADGLKLVSRDFDLVRGYERAVLTPNAVEFERMAASLGLAAGVGGQERGRGGGPRFDAEAFASPSSPPDAPLDAVEAVSAALRGPVVVRKGAGDCMSVAGGASDEEREPRPPSPSPPSSPPSLSSACCTLSGSPRRAGGQGDLTSGAVATFLAWACSSRLLGPSPSVAAKGEGESPPPAALAAAFGGCALVRSAAAAAFARKRRATLASDVLDSIEGADGDVAVRRNRGFDI